jgi:hypothetical protein
LISKIPFVDVDLGEPHESVATDDVHENMQSSFRIDPDGHSINAVELEGFMTTLAGWLPQVQSTGNDAFDPSKCGGRLARMGRRLSRLDPLPAIDQPACAQRYVALLGELAGIAQKVQQDLSTSSFVQRRSSF